MLKHIHTQYKFFKKKKSHRLVFHWFKMRDMLLPDFRSKLSSGSWSKTSEEVNKTLRALYCLLGYVYRHRKKHFFFETSFGFVQTDQKEQEIRLEGLIQAGMGRRWTAGMGLAWVDSLWSQLECVQAECGWRAGLFLRSRSDLKKIWAVKALVHLVWRHFNDYKGK